jgi:hypothetical protein
MLPDPLQAGLLAYYLARCGHSESVAATFWPAAVQRLAQALGAYGRLSAMPGTRRFEAYIPPGLAMLARALTHLDGLPALKALSVECPLATPAVM